MAGDRPGKVPPSMGERQTIDLGRDPQAKVAGLCQPLAMSHDDAESNPLDSLMEATAAAFAKMGIEVAISEELIALTASASGGASYAILLAGPVGFQVQFAKLFATDTYAAAKDLVRRLRESRSGDLRVSDGSVYALIEPDLPDDAILQLAEPLPPAPSGALHYDRATGAWTDSG